MIKNQVIYEGEYKITIKCAACPTVVEKYKSQLQPNSLYAFCSQICRNKNYKKVFPDWRPKAYKGDSEHTCIGCHTTFFVARCAPQSRKYCSKSCSAKHVSRPSCSDQTKAKLSKAATEQNRRYKGKFQYDGVNGFIYMRSSWEVKYAEYLDKKEIGWEYEPKAFALSSGYLYTPDFKLNGGVIIEIKGFWREDARKKWDLFCINYPDIDKQVLMKVDLQKLGVL